MTDPAAARTETGRTTQAGAGCLTLFALPFVIGAVALGYVAVAEVWLAWQAQHHWQRVKVTVDRVELVTRRSDDGTSHRVDAAYHYEMAGHRYRADRVDSGLGDDSDYAYHQRVYRRLARYRGEPLGYLAYVDPDDPTRSLLVADIRWGHSALLLLVCMIAAAIGGSLVVAAVRGRRADRRAMLWRQRYPNEPWRWRLEWRGDTWLADGSARFGGMGWLALVWNLLSAPVPFIIHQQLQVGNRDILPALGLPIVGLLLAGQWIRRRRRGGGVRLQLDRVPVAIGGVLRGRLLLDRLAVAGTEFRLTLRCDRYQRVRGRRGRRHQQLWSVHSKLFAERAAADERGRPRAVLRFRFEVPVGCPDSQWLRQDNETVWRLAVRAVPESAGPQAEFQLPVFSVERLAAGTEQPRPNLVNAVPARSDSGTERP